MRTNKKKEFGDFQTPVTLCKDVINLIDKKYGKPDIIVEPTCGIGNFIETAYNQWGKEIKYYGFELNNEYLSFAHKRFLHYENIELFQADVFKFNWQSFFKRFAEEKILLLGNPPWVTNSFLGTINSKNIPQKNNYNGLSGFESKTGKSNFDVAEWIIITLLKAINKKKVELAMLCKTSSARKVLLHLWKEKSVSDSSELFRIDAKKYFNVSVDAVLLLINFERNINNIDKNIATFYDSLETDKYSFRFGLYKNKLVSDFDEFQKYKFLDGDSNYIWRSGIKHDASKVMELTKKNGHLINGLGEIVDIEKTFLYPLLKSSDLANERLQPTKFVIIPQKKLNEETEKIARIAPKTWEYLNKHENLFNKRKSSIYKEKPKFSIFGIGNYTFAKWKVAISGLYKNFNFVIVPPYKDKPTILDDTCYFIPCLSKEEAEFWKEKLNSKECKSFIKSLVFYDSKRPITIEILKRINFSELAKIHKQSDMGKKYLQQAGMFNHSQLLIVFDKY